MIVFYYLVIITNLYYMLLYLQESHYHFSAFTLITKRIIKNKSSYLLLIPLALLFESGIIVKVSICLVLMIYVMLSLNTKSIVKLNFTPRVKRLFVTFVLINTLLVIMFIYLNINKIIIIYLSEILLFISMLINKPFEYLINRYYIRKAKNKISKINPIVIGITGSAGKTSCKHFLYQMLKDKYITYMTPKSYNTVLGISKSINEDMNEFTEVAIIEFGASHKNDILKSLNIVKPNISLITNIFSQHLETFKTIENIINEKSLLMKNSDVHFYNIDSTYKLDTNVKLFSYGILDAKQDLNKDNIDTNYYGKDIEYSKDGTKFCLCENTNNSIGNMGNKEVAFETKLLGKTNIINIISCIAICRYLKLDYDYIKSRVYNLTPVSSRLELINSNDKVIINDSFNSNKNGFIEALNVLSLFDKKKVIITPGVVTGGSMLESINEELAMKIIECCDYCLLVESIATDYYKNIFNSLNYDYFICDSFDKAYSNTLKDKDVKSILIENDITDIYRRIK